jgi:photosystem II stability/assembly factor-like uncharacterized protein
MKKFFILVFFAGLLSQLLGQNLKILSSPDFKETINDIKFINPTTGWICVNKGMIYKSTDGGQNWFEQNTDTTRNLVKISFVDLNKGWTASIDGYGYKTTNSGETWTKFNYGQAIPGMVFSICDLIKFLNENVGFIIAGKLRQIYLLKTTDGGITWSKKDSLVSTTTARRWYAMDFNGNSGVMVGDKKEIQKYSTDLGETWNFSTTINDNYFRDLKYVKYLSATDIITIGEGNEFSGVPVPVYKSTDGGVNWQKKNQSLITIFDRIKTAYFKDNLNGIGMGSDGFSKAFVVRTTDGGETWTSTVLDYAFSFQAMTGVGDFLFAVGTSSHLVYSTDFGNSWQMLHKKAYSSIIGINFINGKGYAVTRNGDVYFSADGTGNSWTYLSQAGRNLSGASCFLSNKGFVLKENHHIVKTTDNAQTWQTVLTLVNPSSRNLVGGIDFGDLNNGYAWFSQNDYGEYYIYKTSDGGNNWMQVQQFAGPGYISGNLIAFDANTAIALGPDTWTQRTTDGGATWNPATLNNFAPYLITRDFEDVSKIDENRAIAIGEGFMCVTSDKGANWNYINHGIVTIPDSGFYKVAFSSDTLGYIAYYDGTIIKTTNFGLSWTKDTTYQNQYYFFAASINQNGKLMLGTSTGYILGEETPTGISNEINYPTNFSLKQNYPNPFNPVTSIQYSLGGTQFITLKIFDVLGKEITTLVNELKERGDYHVHFSSDDYHITSGIYFYQLRAGNLIQTKKMLLLK